MANFRFKPESILGFHCPGIGTSYDPQDAVSYFKTYLELTDIKTDERGYLNTDQFMTQYLASTATKNSLNQQFMDQYRDQTKNMYNGFLYSQFDGLSNIGYIVLPFKSEGADIKIVLPGTMIHMQRRYSSTSSTSGTVTRTAKNLVIGGNTLSKESFDKSIVPLFLAMLVQGGGGGGSSSENLTSGRGGGGGGANYGMVSLINSPNLSFKVGAGGSGGFHNEDSDGATSANHDGKAGSDSYVTGTKFSLYGYGGKGGTAGSSTNAAGGGVYQSGGYALLTAGRDIINQGVKGGSGSVNKSNPGGSVTRTGLSTMDESSLFTSNAVYASNATCNPGTSHSPGGAGGGATFFGNGASGGNAADKGSNGTAGNGNGGGGGGYHIGMWIDGGAGGSGRVEFFC